MHESVCGAFEKGDIDCKCLKGYIIFSAILREKGYKYHRETPYFVCFVMVMGYFYSFSGFSHPSKICLHLPITQEVRL